MVKLSSILMTAGLSLLPGTKQGNCGIMVGGTDTSALNYSNYPQKSNCQITEFKGIVQYESHSSADADSTKVSHLYHITVQEGDNLSVIADRINSLNRMRSKHPFPKNISWVDIYNWNYSNPLYGGDNISNPDIITPGQQIWFSTAHQIPALYNPSGLTIGS